MTLKESDADGYSHNIDGGAAVWDKGNGGSSKTIAIPHDGDTTKEFYIWSSDGTPTSKQEGHITYFNTASGISEIDFGIHEPTIQSLYLRYCDLTGNYDWSGMVSLTYIYIQSNDLNEVVLPGNNFVGTMYPLNLSANNLKTIRAQGATAECTNPSYVAIDISANDISAEALNQFFTDIDPAPTSIPDNHKIDIKNNIGSATCNTSLAEDKGYMILGARPDGGVRFISDTNGNIDIGVDVASAEGVSTNYNGSTTFSAGASQTITIAHDGSRRSVGMFSSDSSAPETKVGDIIGFYAHDCGLTWIDAETMTKLETFKSYNNPNLKTIDLGSCSTLKILAVQDSGIESLAVGASAFERSDSLPCFRCENNAIATLRAEGASVTNTTSAIACDISNNNLDTAAIDQFFTDLVDVSADGTPDNHKIDIRNNPGTDTCDVTIAEDKGYMIITS